MPAKKGPSLGRSTETNPLLGETATANPTDGSAPISQEAWQRIEATKIAGTLNTASGFNHERMTADFENGLLVSPPQEIAEGIFQAESRLFISEWFDQKLDGSPGIVHGADFMYMISKLVEQTSGSEIESVTDIRFTGIVKNEVAVFVSRDPIPKGANKPVMTAKIHLKTGNDIYITAYDIPNKAITQRSASNTFVQHLCVAPFTQRAAAIKWAQKNEKDFSPSSNLEIELKPLPLEQQAAFNQFLTKNPSGISSSTALDIVITGAQVLAYLGVEAGGIPEVNALGAGFKNVTLPPIDKLIKGCKLKLTVLKDQVRKTENSEFWPIEFTYLDKDNDQTLGQGIFNWVNSLKK